MVDVNVLDEMTKSVCEGYRIYWFPWGTGKNIDGPKFWTRLYNGEYIVHIDFRGDITEYESLKLNISTILEGSGLVLANTELIDDSFYGCEEKLHFEFIKTGGTSDMVSKELKQEIVKCAQANHLGFYSWGSYLPKGSIDDKQLDSNTLGIQLYIPDRSGYAAYEKVKNELTEIFVRYDICFYEEIDLNVKSGWFKELHFMKNKAYQDKIATTIVTKQQTIGTQINGNVNVTGGSIITGNENTISTTPSTTAEKADKG